MYGDGQAVRRNNRRRTTKPRRAPSGAQATAQGKTAAQESEEARNKIITLSPKMRLSVSNVIKIINQIKCPTPAKRQGHYLLQKS